MKTKVHRHIALLMSVNDHLFSNVRACLTGVTIFRLNAVIVVFALSQTRSCFFLAGHLFVDFLLLQRAFRFKTSEAKAKVTGYNLLCNIDSPSLIFEPIPAFFIVRKTSESSRKRRIKEEEDVIFLVVIPCSVRLACKRKAALIGIRSIGS